MSMWECKYCEKWLDFGLQHECPVLLAMPAKIAELEAELVIESERRKKAVAERDRANMVRDHAQAKVTELKQRIEQRCKQDEAASEFGMWGDGDD